MTIAAKPTRYKDQWFKSRLVAEWATVFDSLGVHWAYEPGEVGLDDGSKYWPDFRIGRGQYRRGDRYEVAFVEVKPLEGGHHENVERARRNGMDVWTVYGRPDPEALWHTPYGVVTEPFTFYRWISASLAEALICAGDTGAGDWDAQFSAQRLFYACARSRRMRRSGNDLVEPDDDGDGDDEVGRLYGELITRCADRLYTVSYKARLDDDVYFRACDEYNLITGVLTPYDLARPDVGRAITALAHGLFHSGLWVARLRELCAIIEMMRARNINWHGHPRDKARIAAERLWNPKR